MGGFIVIFTFLTVAMIFFVVQFFVRKKWKRRLIIIANSIVIAIILAHFFGTLFGFESPMGQNGWDNPHKNYPKEALEFLGLMSWLVFGPIFLGSLLGTALQKLISNVISDGGKDDPRDLK